MIRGCYGSVFCERGGQEAEFFVVFGASNEDGGCFSRLFRPFEVQTG
jgi:hypothetical protein